MERLVLLTITFIALLFISILFCVNASNVKAIQNFTEITKPQCKFSYNQSQNDPLLQLCFEPITQIGNEISEHNVPMLSNQSVITDSVTPTINMHNFNSSKIWKPKVSFPLADHANFDNVGEPSFASNGTLVFYAGNHYTARSIIGKNWEYVDPNFDFKGIEGFNQTSSSNSTVVPGKTISIFKADQHINLILIVKCIYGYVREIAFRIVTALRISID